jgi:hypothetical protein
VAAGIPIQIDIIGQTGSKGWSARIGCHSDDLEVCLISLLLLYALLKIEM